MGGGVIRIALNIFPASKASIRGRVFPGHAATPLYVGVAAKFVFFSLSLFY
jgi:hypothetical protein